jgi:branched-chain amino acid transport system permease protein
MNFRLRPYLLGILGLAALTFPFLWLQLAPDFTKDTVNVTWAPWHGLQFFGDLSPVFVIAFLIWLGIQFNRRFGWDQALAANPTWQRAGHVWTQYWAWGTMPLVLSCVFFFSPSSLSLFTAVGIYMLLALGLNITVGMTGLLVLGYAGFYGFGAYFFALAQQNLGWFPWWMAAPLAFFLGGGAGYLLGLPCLRLRGDYLAIVTLGFAEAFRELMRNLSNDDTTSGTQIPFFRELAHIFDTGGDKGIIIGDHSVFRSIPGINHEHPTMTSGQVAYIITALVLFLAVFLVQRLYHSPVGRAWMAIRENEVAAAAVGVPVVQMKLLAFSLSAAIAAMAGVLYGAKNGFVSPDICNFQQSIMVLAMVILGGLGNSYGALLGAALLYLVPAYMEFLPSTISGNPVLSAIVPGFVRDSLQRLSDYRLLLFGAVMVLMMLYRPQGLLGSRRRKTEMLHK